jgi:hypothetical protein
MSIKEYEFPEDSDLQPCPMGCGRITEDVGGGPCEACWQEVDENESERRKVDTSFINKVGIKRDRRKKLGGWGPGRYQCRCIECNTIFLGDKRAVVCADCAYGQQDTVSTVGRSKAP